MNAGKRYQIDRTRIIFEQFEDETVLVNTETGYYYSLSNTGSEVLRLLDEGCSADDLPIILFGSSSSEDTHQRWDIVRKFVEKLVDESIIAARSSDSSNHIGKDPGPAPLRRGDRIRASGARAFRRRSGSAVNRSDPPGRSGVRMAEGNGQWELV